MNIKHEIEILKTELDDLKTRLKIIEELLPSSKFKLIPSKNKVIEEFKRYTMQNLRQTFDEAGYPVSDSWIRRQIKRGNLVLPRSTTHFAKFHIKGDDRKTGAVYEMTEAQINDVVKAFVPGGSGYYNYLKAK